MTRPQATAQQHLFGPEMLQDPYPTYHRLRAADPVHWNEQNQMWVLTRYDDVTTLLRDPRVSSDRFHQDRINPAKRAQYEPIAQFLRKAMLHIDAPQHTRLRLLVNKAFTPRTVEQLAPFIQQTVDQCLAQFSAAGSMDLLHDLAETLPILVITEMLGVPGEDRVQLKKWSDDLALLVGNTAANHPDSLFEKVQQSQRHLFDYLRPFLQARRQEPRNDLISALVHAEDAGQHLSEEEILANTAVLLNAGHETTTNLIGNGMKALLENPEQLALLRQDPARINNAVEECLRYDSPVQFTSRYAREDLVVGGKTIGKGQQMLLLLGAANRDPGHFPEPDRLDVQRREIKHLAFGAGPHFCLGAPLARLEGQIVFRTLVERFANLRLAGEPIHYRTNFNLRGLTGLKIAF